VETGDGKLAGVALPDTPAGLLSPGRRLLTIGLTLVVTMIGFEALAVATAMPVVEDDLGGLQLYGLVFSGFMVANLVGAAYAGLEADRREPAVPFAAGLGLFGAGLVLGGLAPSMEVLVAARCVQGLGAGMVVTLAYVGIARGYGEALRPRMFAVLSSAWVVPGMVGPALAGAVADHLTWRLVFLGLVPLLPLAGLLTLPAMRRLAPENDTKPGGNRLLYSVVLAFGAGLVLVASTLSEAAVIVPLVAGGFVIAVLALRVLLPAGTFTAAPGLPAAVAVLGITSAAFFGAEAFLPLALTDVRGQSPTVAGLALTAATLSWTAGAWIQAQRAQVWSRRSVVIAGIFFVTAGIAVAGSVTANEVPVIAAAIGWGVGGLGMGLAYSAVSLTILSEAPEEQTGYASSSLHFANVLGVAVGAGIAGAIVGAGDAADWGTGTSTGAAFAVMAGLAIIASGTALRLPGRPFAATAA
jgi:MFS family permease